MFVGNIVLLKELFLLIDENYELNIFDEEKIDDLNKKNRLWALDTEWKDWNDGALRVVEEIFEKIKRNLQEWSNDAPTKLNIFVELVLFI